ncbi:hypothetical protein FJTKL_12907 [Diaporthe vaccinii]|uniref:Uncharacterized protein n=1 Tax=Diaporthe vaccinii TaxID=105482 RepID=A0ABR4FAK6_9PEZI
MYKSSRTPAPTNPAKSPATLGVRELFTRAQPTTGAAPKHASNRLGQWLSGRRKASPIGWKPHTIRAPVLCAVVVISLGLAGVLEFLAQKSQRQGGLALSSSEDDISESVNIAYLYMATTVAVLYSLLWTWIDLDVRRMQPWFELSRPHGANAEQSLLLNYPFEFLAFVPFKA